MIKGINMLINPENIPTSRIIAIITASVLGNFNFRFKNCITGLAIKESTAEMAI
jgi:hypothetical protein